MPFVYLFRVYRPPENPVQIPQIWYGQDEVGARNLPQLAQGLFRTIHMLQHVKTGYHIERLFSELPDRILRIQNEAFPKPSGQSDTFWININTDRLKAGRSKYL